LKASKSEIEEKEGRVRAFLERNGLSAFCFTTSKNFAWLTCGGDNHVELTNRMGVATAVVTPDDKYVIADNIEAGRILAEEIEDQGYTVRETRWYDDRRFEIIREVVGRGRIGADLAFPGAEMMDEEASPLRYSLTPEEIERYRELGRLTAASLKEASEEIEPGQTEHEIGAVMARHLLARGVVPAVILVAVDERIEKYRHPIPTDKTMERYAMLVTCGRKWGLIASATRLVHFGRIPDELARKHEACTKIDAGLIARNKEGEAISGLLAKAIEDYAATGYADQWRFHHQGGPTGYQARDFFATPSTTEVVRRNQAFAWNPSIAGTKSEDTVIPTKRGPIIVTETSDWPMIDHEIEGLVVERPDIKAV